MYRRAYALLVGTAAVMGALAIFTALMLNKSLADPDGFLGPSWLRLPLLVDVTGVGELAAVAAAPAPGPGEEVRLAVDAARLAVIPVD